MANYVYCEHNNYDTIDFYVEHNHKKYYLFTQRWRRGIVNYFQNKVTVTRSLDKTYAMSDRALCDTMNKLPMYLRYLEREQGIVLLDKKASKPRLYKANCTRCNSTTDILCQVA